MKDSRNNKVNQDEFNVKEALLRKVIKDELDSISPPDLDNLFHNIIKKIGEGSL